MTERPWTPGPWRLVEGPAYRGSDRTYTIYVDDERYESFLTDEQYYPAAPVDLADAKLIALAPEMAELILMYHKCRYPYEDGMSIWEQDLSLMAHKLKEITND